MSAEKRLRRALAFALGSAIALGLAVVLLVLRPTGAVDADPEELLELALASVEVREAAMRELVRRGEGVWDSYVDPDVGRVLQRDVEEREFRGVPVSSNALGMREAPYEVEKPDGVTRVVLLGDSFVFGYKVRAEERLGVFLRGFLEERAGTDARVEVLHLAASSWNIRAECAYLRRQLDRLRPDLVVHVIVVNDLDDLQGVRGFGAMASYSPQHRERADGLLTILTPQALWPRRLPTYLIDGLDHESRARFAEAAGDLARLAGAVEELGGRYLALAAWEGYSPLVWRHFGPALGAERLAFVPRAFTRDLRFRIDRSDRHWNPAGHEVMATLLYGLIVERGLLPGLAPAPWDRAQQAVRELHVAGLREAREVEAYEAALAERAREAIEPTLDLVDLRQRNARQVHGGIDAAGNVAPYAAVILRNDGARELVVEGRRFPQPLLAGGTARVLVEEHEVGVLALDGPVDFEERYALPADVTDRPFLGVRFVSDDHLIVDVARGDAAAFVLRRLTLR